MEGKRPREDEDNNDTKPNKVPKAEDNNHLTPNKVFKIDDNSLNNIELSILKMDISLSKETNSIRKELDLLHGKVSSLLSNQMARDISMMIEFLSTVYDYEPDELKMGIMEWRYKNDIYSFKTRPCKVPLCGGRSNISRCGHTHFPNEARRMKNEEWRNDEWKKGNIKAYLRDIEYRQNNIEARLDRMEGNIRQILDKMGEITSSQQIKFFPLPPTVIPANHPQFQYYGHQ